MFPFYLLIKKLTVMEFNGGGFEELSEESIFKKVSEFDLFRYYIPDFEALNKKFSSPFRSDRSPSCSIREFNGKLFYKDFGSGKTYTVINFLKELYSLNYYEVLNVISNDFDLGLNNKKIDAKSMGYVGEKGLIVKSAPKETILRIKRRKWNNKKDMEYWKPYGLNKNILNYFNIVPISNLWVNNLMINVSDKQPSYAYILGEGLYKVLSPYSEHKWISNCKNTIQGYNQLPDNGDILVITKALKDCMVLYKYGIPAIAPQSENTAIDINVMNNLKKRFKRIIVFFDNDDPGIKAAEVYKELYNLEYTHIPIGLSKDISDYAKEHSDSLVKELLNKLI